MDREKLKELGDKWKEWNDKYDREILKLIDTEGEFPLTKEKLEELNKMQDELFDLEREIFNILQG